MQSVVGTLRLMYYESYEAEQITGLDSHAKLTNLSLGLIRC
jgi:hypothetical protein